MSDETFITAIRVTIPTEQSDVMAVIDKINDHISVQPIQLAFFDYEEFIDHDRDNDDYGYIDRHDCFMFDMFAELIADHWTLLNVLHRNGDNSQVREFHAYLDEFVNGCDTADDFMNLDF